MTRNGDARTLARAASLAAGVISGCASVPAPVEPDAPPAPSASAAAARPARIETVLRSEALTWPLVVTDTDLFTVEVTGKGGERRVLRSALAAPAERRELLRGRDLHPRRAGGGFTTLLRGDDDVSRAAYVDAEGRVTLHGPAEEVAWDERGARLVLARPPAADGSVELVAAAPREPSTARSLGRLPAPGAPPDPRGVRIDALAASPAGIAAGVREPRDPTDAAFRATVFFLADGATAPARVQSSRGLFRLDFLASGDLLVTGLATVAVGRPAAPREVPGLFWDDLALDGDVVYAFTTLTTAPARGKPGSRLVAWRPGAAPVDVATEELGLVEAIALGGAHVYWLTATHELRRADRSPGF